MKQNYLKTDFKSEFVSITTIERPSNALLDFISKIRDEKNESVRKMTNELNFAGQFTIKKRKNL